MKAAYKSNREKGIKIIDVPIPKISENEILVKVKKAAICGTDIHLYDWNQWCKNAKAKNPIRPPGYIYEKFLLLQLRLLKI